MINLFVWLMYGVIVGLISKAIYKYENSPSGFASTLAIGISGSFVGGFINYLLINDGPMKPAGLAMGVLGGVITCYLYKKFILDQKK
jgi:uncharacterized membrane protein YeaQ/YmgE (transglycosylase-associated protein family)